MSLKNSKKVIKTIIFLIFILSLVILEVSDYGEKGIINYCSSFQIFDMQWNYTVDSVYESLMQLPSEGVTHYKYYLIVDTVMTLALAGVQYYLIELVTKERFFKRIFIALASIRAISDLVENVSLMYILTYLPSHYNKTVILSSIFTKIKFTALITFWILFIILYVVSVCKRFKSRN